MPKSAVQAAFEKQIVTLPINIIVPQKETPAAARLRLLPTHHGLSEAYRSDRTISCLSPCARRIPAAGRTRSSQILKSMGVTEAKCLLSTDDEAYTYNRHVNQIPPIAQHFMLLGALKNGLTEERIATALDVSIESIRARRDLLNGICPEAVQVLLDKPSAPTSLGS